MRKISASYIISNVGIPLKNGILLLNDDNSVADLIDRKGSVKEIQNLEYYSGVLVPGFVDAFTFLSWPEMNTTIVDSNRFSELNLGKQGDFKTHQKCVNHLEAFGTKGAADYFPTGKFQDIKESSMLCFRDFYENADNLKNKSQPEFLDLIQGRLFPNNISSDKAFCIGTGSLFTHTKLSVFEELKFLQSITSNLRLEQLIKWASLNGAAALGFDHLGSFEVGKMPGVNLITNLDYENFRLKPESKLKVLI